MKVFNTKKITRRQLRQKICAFAKANKINKVIFSNRAKKVSGTYNASTKNIYISLNQNKKEMLLTFFHELGHHQATIQNKWKKYHYGLYKYMYIDTVFDIENKIDRIGKKLWNKYVYLKQWGKYNYFYPKKHKNLYMKTKMHNDND